MFVKALGNGEDHGDDHGDGCFRLDYVKLLH